jgi:uridine phosphorylase
MAAPSFPNFAGKHAGEAIVGPAEYVAYARRRGSLDGYQPPPGVVLCFPASVYQHVLRAEGVEPGAAAGPHGVIALPSTAGQVGLVHLGIGAPLAAVALEELAAVGTTAFVSIGTAGGLQRDLAIGDIVLCEAAVRDEGVSHHYLPAARLVGAEPVMTARLRAALDAAGVGYRAGQSWTIDAPYRETTAEARHYQADGVLSVEMEAAALFAVARFRGLRLAAAFAISDSLAGGTWDPQFHQPRLRENLTALHHAAVSALQHPGAGAVRPESASAEDAAGS